MIFLQRNGLILGVSKIIIIGKLIYLCIESKLYPNSLFYAVKNILLVNYKIQCWLLVL